MTTPYPPEYQDVAMVKATYSAALNAVVGILAPHTHKRRIVLLALTGPANSSLAIYRGNSPSGAPINTVFPADVRTYDASSKDAPMVIWAGDAATFAWTGGSVKAGATAQASVTSVLDF